MRKNLTSLLLLGLLLGLITNTWAAKIILVTETRDNDGNGIQDDQGLIDWLNSLGHEVDVQIGYWATLDAGKIAQLNAADLIIFSRSCTSANYATDATEISQWDSIDTPIILNHAYIARNNRNLWVNSTAITNLVGPALEIVELTHPIFSGIDNGALIVDSTTGTGQTSFVGTLDVGNGKVLAKTGNNAWIVEWQPGLPFYTGSGVPAAKRMLFCCQTQEVGSTTWGGFNLTDVGKKLYLNVINYLMGIVANPGVASGPSPKDKATDVPRDAVLSWTPGAYPGTHDVYLGLSQEDLEAATRQHPKGLLVSKGQTATTYDPVGLLAYDQTYYWRIDEVNSNDGFIHKGQVWSFTVEPYSYPLKPIAATASSRHSALTGPEKTIDSSGLAQDDSHGTVENTMWLSSAKGPTPPWIQYEFDDLYKLDKLMVWNYNQALEALLGLGAKEVKIEASADGEVWTQIGQIQEFAQAPGGPGYQSDILVDMAGAMAKYVKLTILSNWGGLPQTGLSEVRFFYIPVKAFGPNPADGATGVALDAVASWRMGREVATHQFYIGQDPHAVAASTTPTRTSTEAKMPLGPLGLEYARKYYWRVDEVNQAQVWKGPIWSFATADYAVIDDFESYNDTCKRIFFTWVDGLGHSGAKGCGVEPASGNGTGSTVGNLNPPFAERTIVNSGAQSMPFGYDNTKPPYYSEATRTFEGAQDWTVGGVDTLTIYLRGEPAAFIEVSPGVILMNGMGTDIWDTSDQFRFVYKKLTGNGSITARVDGVAYTHVWAKAGVMIRETLDPGSRHAMVVVTPGSGVSFQRRPETNQASASTTQAGLVAPYWVRLTRNGNTFIAQCSADGINWTSVGPDAAQSQATITMANDIFIGLAVTSHAAGVVCGAKFANVSTTGNVTGTWQVAEIGTTQVDGNSQAPVYVVIQDALGTSKLVVSPDTSLVAAGIWQRLDIPLNQVSAAGVKLNKIAKLTIGVGDKASPKPGTSGKVYIDDIRLTRTGQ